MYLPLSATAFPIAGSLWSSHWSSHPSAMRVNTSRSESSAILLSRNASGSIYYSIASRDKACAALTWHGVDLDARPESAVRLVRPGRQLVSGDLSGCDRDPFEGHSMSSVNKFAQSPLIAFHARTPSRSWSPSW